MPLHLNSISNNRQESEILAFICDHELNKAESAFVTEDKKYLHLTKTINDKTNGERIGKFVFTIFNDEIANCYNLLGIDIVIDTDHTTPLHFFNRLEESSDANEYYEVETIDDQQHLEVETVNRHTITGDISDTTRDVYISAFPFALNVFEDIKEFNGFAGFSKDIKVGNTEYSVNGYAEDFASTGAFFGAEKGEIFSFLLGKVISFRDVHVQLGEITLNFVIAQLQTALGALPTVMNRDEFDLRYLSVGKLIAMKAAIKVDFAK